MSGWERRYTPGLGTDVSQSSDPGGGKSLSNRNSIVPAEYTKNTMIMGGTQITTYRKGNTVFTEHSVDDIAYASLLSVKHSTGYWYWGSGFYSPVGLPTSKASRAEIADGGDAAGGGWDQMALPRPVPFGKWGLVTVQFIPSITATQRLSLGVFSYSKGKAVKRFVTNTLLEPFVVEPGAYNYGHEYMSDLSFRRKTDYQGVVTTFDYSCAGYCNSGGVLKLALFNLEIPSDFPDGDYWFSDDVTPLVTARPTMPVYPTNPLMYQLGTYEVAGTKPAKYYARYDIPAVQWVSATTAMLVEVDVSPWPIHWTDARLNPNKLANHNDVASLSDPYTPDPASVISGGSKFSTPFPYWGRILRYKDGTATELKRLVPLLKEKWTVRGGYANVTNSAVTLAEHAGSCYAVVTGGVEWANGAITEDPFSVQYTRLGTDWFTMIVKIPATGTPTTVFYKSTYVAGGATSYPDTGYSTGYNPVLVSSCATKDLETLAVYVKSRYSTVADAFYEINTANDAVTQYAPEDPAAKDVPARRARFSKSYAAAHLQYVKGGKYITPLQDGENVGCVRIVLNAETSKFGTTKLLNKKVAAPDDVPFIVTTADYGNAIVPYKWDTRYLWWDLHPAAVL